MYTNRGLGTELKFEIKKECDITFFVPCLNEEQNIGPTLDNIRAALKSFNYTFQVLIIDDCSRDNTVRVIEDYKLKNPSIRIDLVKNTMNRGLGRNYVDASYLGCGRYFMLINGDNAEPKETIEAIISKLGEADIIIPHFGRDDRRNFSRSRLSLFFTWLVNLISGHNISYYNGPALHLRENIIRWHSDTYGFAYQAEVITRLLDEGATYTEIEVVNTPRQVGVTSAFRLVNVLSVSHSLLQIFIRRVRKTMFSKRVKPMAQAGQVKRNQVVGH